MYLALANFLSFSNSFSVFFPLFEYFTRDPLSYSDRQENLVHAAKQNPQIFVFIFITLKPRVE